MVMMEKTKEHRWGVMMERVGAERHHCESWAGRTHHHAEGSRNSRNAPGPRHHHVTPPIPTSSFANIKLSPPPGRLTLLACLPSIYAWFLCYTRDGKRENKHRYTVCREREREELGERMRSMSHSPPLHLLHYKYPHTPPPKAHPRLHTSLLPSCPSYRSFLSHFEGKTPKKVISWSCFNSFGIPELAVQGSPCSLFEKWGAVGMHLIFSYWSYCAGLDLYFWFYILCLLEDGRWNSFSRELIGLLYIYIYNIGPSFFVNPF